MNTLRRFSRRAPVLHGYLMAMLILMPVPLPQGRALAEDPPPEWTYLRSESSSTISLSAPQGTADVQMGESRTLNISLTRNSWEVWESTEIDPATGERLTETRNETSYPPAFVPVNLSVSSGGSVTSNVATDEYGHASAVFTMGSTREVHVVTVVDGDSTATLEFQPGPEEYVYERHESGRFVTIDTGATAFPMQPGASAWVEVVATDDTWEVWESNWGGSETRNSSSSPASGAHFAWTLTGPYGTGPTDGVLTGTLSGQLEANGRAAVLFTQGSLPSLLRVVVEYDQASGSATLGLNPDGGTAEVWEMDHTEGYVTVALTAPDGTSDLIPGQEYDGRAHVRFTSWEVWTSNWGGLRPHENETTTDAENAAVGLTVQSGVAGLSTTSGFTAADGSMDFQFSLTEDSQLRATVSYGDSTVVTGDLDLSVGLETWTQTGSGTDVTANVVKENSTAARLDTYADVTYTQWQDWTSSTGRTERRTISSGPALGAAVTFSVEVGTGKGRLVDTSSAPEALVTTLSVQTGSNGRATVPFQAGASATRIEVTASFDNGSGTGAVTVSNLDTDGDGYSNADEIAEGSNPLDSRDYPGRRYFPLRITLPAMQAGEVGETYAATPTASVTGGSNVGSVSFTGPMFDTNGQPQSWTPSAAGPYTVTASVSDDYGSASASTTITVLPEAPYVLVGGGLRVAEFEDQMVTFTFTLTRNGLPAAGRVVTFDDASTAVTDSSGQVTQTLPGAPDAGIRMVTATFDGLTAYGALGSAAKPAQQINPGNFVPAALELDDSPVPVTDPLVESRTLSYSTGTLDAHISCVYWLLLGNVPQFFPQQGNSVTIDGLAWKSSDPARPAGTGAGPPSMPTFSDTPAQFPWSAGLAAVAQHWELPGEFGEIPDHIPVEGLELSGTTPAWTSLPGVIWSISKTGQGRDYVRASGFQVRLKRPEQPPPPVGEPPLPKPSMSRSFIKVTEKPDPMDATKRVQVFEALDPPLIIPIDQDLSPVLTVGPPEKDHKVYLLPVELILDSNNIAYKPDSEALGVSNYVTNNELPATSLFGDTNPDPENFRLQARLPNATTNSVQMKLEVKRDGSVIITHNYTLDKKDGDFVRGKFLRLVTDTNDGAESGDQTILVKLGDKIKASYDITAGNEVKQEIQVGRPSSEDNNEADKPWKHDIREVKVRIVAVKDEAGNACVTDAKVNELVDNANERLAQAGIRLKRTQDTVEVIEPPSKPADDVGPTYIYDQHYQDGLDSGNLTSPSQDEIAFSRSKDGDSNTVDIFFVKHFKATVDARAIAYWSSKNKTEKPALSNFIVISAAEVWPFTMPHEIMHVLLNRGHRPTEPDTALFFSPTSQFKSGFRKRIGPYPQALTNNAGNNDTTTLRSNAEKLP